MLCVCLTAAASLTSVVTVPLFMNAALHLFSEGQGAGRLPVLSSSPRPLHRLDPARGGRDAPAPAAPAAARAIEARVGAIGLAAIPVLVAAVVWSEKDNMLPALAQAGGPALLLNVVGHLPGRGIAALAGLDRGQRIAVTLECGLQNFRDGRVRRRHAALRRLAPPASARLRTAVFPVRRPHRRPRPEGGRPRVAPAPSRG